MGFRTVSTFLTQVTTLNDTATELRRSLLDNQSSIRRIDAVARTEFLEQWEGCREEFQRILEMSEGAAIKVSATIDYYLSLQEETNDPAEADETIQEISAFHNKLPHLGPDQKAEFGHLDTCLDTLGKDIFVVVLERQDSICTKVDKTAAWISSLEKGLEQLYEKRRQRQHEAAWAGAQDVWTTHGSRLFNAESRAQYTAQLTHTGATPQIRAWIESPTRPLIGGWDFEEDYEIARIEGELKEMRGNLSRAKSELQEFKDLNINEMRDVIEEIRRKLVTQSELQENIFSGVKTRLTDESERYLDALQASRVDASPTKQLAYRNAKQHILSSSVGWEQKARALVDEYAKKMK